uniref:Transposase n=1 Tax=Syphacia muris TaxID=451379 RepID=A0A0N5AZ51_9BILA
MIDPNNLMAVCLDVDREWTDKEIRLMLKKQRLRSCSAERRKARIVKYAISTTIITTATNGDYYKLELELELELEQQ